MKIVKVEWLDACSDGGYLNKRDYLKEHKPVVCETVGHLFKKNKGFILLAGVKLEDGDLRHTHTIPRKMVTKITYLTEKK